MICELCSRFQFHCAGELPDCDCECDSKSWYSEYFYNYYNAKTRQEHHIKHGRVCDEPRKNKRLSISPKKWVIRYQREGPSHPKTSNPTEYMK
jgi:hypothetical protein